MWTNIIFILSKTQPGEVICFVLFHQICVHWLILFQIILNFFLIKSSVRLLFKAQSYWISIRVVSTRKTFAEVRQRLKIDDRNLHFFIWFHSLLGFLLCLADDAERRNCFNRWKLILISRVSQVIKRVIKIHLLFSTKWTTKGQNNFLLNFFYFFHLYFKLKAIKRSIAND